ncbi:MAG: UDP-N-acetylmuramoyl-tripeptide--D-alanyl-D-alanine ligase [Georgfuchsia sp.]
MMRLSEAATLIGARIDNADTAFTSVFSDSRAIASDGLFIALRGERFDGHEFVTEAIAQGAAAAMVDTAWAATHANERLPLLVVEDTRMGLGQLAAAWRARFAIPLIAVTGSNGKTTVKDMCAAIMAAQVGVDHVLATSGNFNNDIGLPLTLLQLREQHRAAVIEMGMNHTGEISYLASIARPTVALVNNAQRAHLEHLGSIAAVARAKGEIFEGLDRDGTAIINADDPCAGILRELASSHRLMSFGLDAAAGISVTAQSGGEFGYFSNGIILRTPMGNAEFELHLPGRHNLQNALAAAAACLATGASLAAVANGLAGYRGAKGRLQRKTGERGAALIDDSYNANPDSMRAAIDVLAQLPGKRLFVMGDMGEVGVTGGQFHDELGGYAKSQGIDRLYCLGSLSVAAAHNFGEGGAHFNRIDDLIKAVRQELDANTTVLVKGSRFMRMERVVEALESNTGGKSGPAAGPSQGGVSQKLERTESANTHRPLPREGGGEEGKK